MKIMKGNKMNNTNNEDLDKNIALEQMIDDFSSNMSKKKRGKTRIERKYDKYSKKFKDKFEHLLFRQIDYSFLIILRRKELDKKGANIFFLD